MRSAILYYLHIGRAILSAALSVSLLDTSLLYLVREAETGNDRKYGKRKGQALCSNLLAKS